MQLYCCHRIWHACFRMQISHYAIASLVKYFSKNKYIHQKLGRVSFRVDGSALWQLRDHPVLFNKLFQVTLRVERSSYWICTTNLPQHRTSCTCWSHPLKGKLGQTELAAAGAPRAVGLPGTTLPSSALCVPEVLPAPSLQPYKLQLLPKTFVIQPKCLPTGAGRGSLAVVFCFSLICKFSNF